MILHGFLHGEAQKHSFETKKNNKHTKHVQQLKKIGDQKLTF